MALEKVEGIVLRSFPYKEKNHIITVFSRENGLISLLTKKRAALSNCFCKGEFIYRKTNSDLYRLSDGSILDTHLHLRDSSKTLFAVGKMGKAILTLLPPQASSVSIYQLFTSYITQISHFPNPYVLSTSFYLKLLKHEGLLHIHPLCNRCRKQRSSHLFHGESLCSNCHVGLSSFSLEEFQTLYVLSESRSFNQLEKLDLTKQLEEKTHKICKERNLI